MKALPVLAEQVKNHPFPLLFATISGSHLYGFSSEDSDWDLRGAHILPLAQVVGLIKGKETIERSAVIEGWEIDLVTHEVEKFLSMLLKKNGYVLEQLLSPLIVHTTTYHEELKHLVSGCITRHHAHHYLGFAQTEWGLIQKENPVRVKPLLYLYRVLLTGIHLMRTGQVEPNLVKLNQEARLSYIDDLISKKTSGHERETLEDADREFHQREYERLRTILNEAYETSSLPLAPTATPALNDLLIRIRLEAKGGSVS